MPILFDNDIYKAKSTSSGVGEVLYGREEMSLLGVEDYDAVPVVDLVGLNV